MKVLLKNKDRIYYLELEFNLNNGFIKLEIYDENGEIPMQWDAGMDRFIRTIPVDSADVPKVKIEVGITGTGTAWPQANLAGELDIYFDPINNGNPEPFAEEVLINRAPLLKLEFKNLTNGKRDKLKTKPHGKDFWVVLNDPNFAQGYCYYKIHGELRIHDGPTFKFDPEGRTGPHF